MNSSSRGKPPEVIRESQLALKVFGMSLKGREREEPTQTADGNNTAKKNIQFQREREKRIKEVCVRQSSNVSYGQQQTLLDPLPLHDPGCLQGKHAATTMYMWVSFGVQIVIDLRLMPFC